MWTFLWCVCVCVCSEDETPSAVNAIRISFDNEYPLHSLYPRSSLTCTVHCSHNSSSSTVLFERALSGKKVTACIAKYLWILDRFFHLENSRTHGWLSGLVSLCAFFHGNSEVNDKNLVICCNLSYVNTFNRNTEVSTLDSLLIELVN